LAITIVSRSAGDGRRVIGAHYADLGTAVRIALELADTHGRDAGSDQDPPTHFDVHVDAELALSVSVLPGGLCER
jgi:hypothetical protein